MSLAAKTALITGASSGIGRACAFRLARDGARLILAGRNRAALEETAAETGAVAIVEADLTIPGDLARFCDRVLEAAPVLDILVHNAGVGIYAPSFATDAEKAKTLMALNLLAPVEITRRLLPRIPRGGSVVAISSIAGKVALPGMAVYCASKHALNAYVAILRMESGQRGIHVLSVCPGYVKTPFIGNMLQGETDRRPERRGRFGITAEQCAEAIRQGILNRKRTVVVPRIGWLLVAAERLLPVMTHKLMTRHLLGDDTG